MNNTYQFGKLKQNFANGDLVVIGQTTSELDGLYATVTGISYADEVCAFYIITRMSPFPNGWNSIQLIESCLCKVETVKEVADKILKSIVRKNMSVCKEQS